MKNLKIGVVQLDVKVNNYKANLECAERMIEQCVNDGADIVCLPEAFATSLNLPKAKELSQTIEGEICTYMRNIAKAKHIFLIGGFIENEHDKVFSTAICIDPQGNIIGKYQRRYIYALEKHFITGGTKSCLIDTPLGKLGIIMGYDINFPESCRELFRKKVEIIISPTQIPKVYYKSTRQLAIARATENNCYFVLVSSCGQNTIARLEYMGGSIISRSATGLELYSTQYTQQEEVLGALNHEEGYIVVELNMSKIKREIEDSSFYDDYLE